MRRSGSAFCRVYLAEMELIQDLAPSSFLSSCFLWGFRVKQAVKQLFFFVCCYLLWPQWDSWVHHFICHVVLLPNCLIYDSLHPAVPRASPLFIFIFSLSSRSFFQILLFNVDWRNSKVFESNMQLINRQVNMVSLCKWGVEILIHVQQPMTSS